MNGLMKTEFKNGWIYEKLRLWMDEWKLMKAEGQG